MVFSNSQLKLNNKVKILYCSFPFFPPNIDNIYRQNISIRKKYTVLAALLYSATSTTP